jgi:hypothetical protein
MDPSGPASEAKEIEKGIEKEILPPRDRQNGHGVKAVWIRDACRTKDLDALRALSTSQGGLVSDELRRLAC